MKSSIVYLLILLGTSLGVALGGVLGGLVGGVGLFLLHRVYVLSKRLSDIDKLLNSLDERLSLSNEKPTPPSLVANDAEVVVTPVVASENPLAESHSTAPASPDNDAIAALNRTLQALMPMLVELKSPAAVPSTEVMPKLPSQPVPPQVTAAVDVSHTHNELRGNIEKPEISEVASIATTIEHVLLDALHNSTLASLPQSVERQAPPPAAQHMIAAPVLPITSPSTPNTSAIPSHYQHVENDLGQLKDELSTLMSDISAEYARQSQTGQGQPVSVPTTQGAPVEARSLQELLIELQKLTAQIPPSKG